MRITWLLLCVFSFALVFFIASSIPGNGFFSKVSQITAVIGGFLATWFSVYTYYNNTNNNRVVVDPPGSLLSKILKFIYSKKTNEKVFDEMRADMETEYFEALDKNEIWKTRWIHLRWFINVVIAMMAQSLSAMKVIVTFWKIGS